MTKLLGYDSASRVSTATARLAKNDGRDFWVRYYSYSPRKNLTLEEARAIVSQGLKVVSVFEGGGDHIGWFSETSGKNDAYQAQLLASQCRQPEGGTIYFAVDMDVTRPQLPLIQAYFEGIHGSGLVGHGLVGVYGSGLVCQAMLDAGLVDRTWLAGPHGWAGYNAFLGKQDMLQLMWDPNAKVNGIPVDRNEANSDTYGGWEPAP